MPDYTLGLDLGPNSIGWALIETEFDDEMNAEGEFIKRSPKKYVGFLDTSRAKHPPLGARVFEAGLPNYGTAKEMSLNQARRVARSARRVHSRRSARKKRMRKLLTSAGFLPDDDAAFHELMKLNPYELRAGALDELLEPLELGRVLYHLVQHRGFRSNRKETTKSPSEEKGMLKEISELETAIQESGSRTLGEYLFRLGFADGENRLLRGELRLRNRHTRRSMYLEELKRILEKQREYHEKLAAIEDRIHHIIFFQHSYEVTEERRKTAPSRANLQRSPQLRRCPLEPSERRCPLQDPVAQEFRILKQLTDLKVREPLGNGNSNGFRRLNQAEWNVALEALAHNKTVSFSSLRKHLSKTGTHPEAFFNLEWGKRDKLSGDHITAPIGKAIGSKSWGSLTEDEQLDIRDRLVALETDEDETAFLERAESLKLGETQIEKLLKLNFNDQAGYLSYSKKAIQKLLPYLRTGGSDAEMNEYLAKKQAYPDRIADEAWKTLPSLVTPGVPDKFRDITNPIVRRALTEVRKLVNAIVREHGLPKQIVIEMAREMKMTSKQRSEYISNMRKREKERDAAKEEVRTLGGNPNDREQVFQYLLWKEQDCRCLYTGRSIPQSELFSGSVEIDHILPHWRSLDNTQENKVLVYREANHDKGQRTVSEWLGQDSQQYGQILSRVMDVCVKQPEISRMSSAIAKRPLPIIDRATRVASLWGAWPKRLRRLLIEELKEDGFTRGQLKDTQYLARATKSYLELLYAPGERRGEKAVRSTRGGLTAELRRQWGLNLGDLIGKLDTKKGVISEPEEAAGDKKLRIDHRHHAVDAVVVALSSRSSLKQYQDYLKVREEAKKPVIGLPWHSLRDDTKHSLEEVLVSHRPMRRLSNAFHEETFLGRVEENNGAVVVVTRVSLESLSGKQVEHIRDKEIQRLVRARLMEKGWDGEANIPPKDWFREPLFMKSGIPVRKCRVLSREGSDKVVALGDQKHRLARLGNNHCLTVYEDPDGKLYFSVISTMEAAENIRIRKLPIAPKELPDGKRLTMLLCRKDAVLLKKENGESTLCVLQKMSGTRDFGGSMQIVFREHNDSRTATECGLNPIARFQSANAWKQAELEQVEVDPLGRLHGVK